MFKGKESDWDFKKNVDVEYYNMIPAGSSYVLYNWFVNDPSVVSSTKDISTDLALKIKTIDGTSLYQAPCYLRYNAGESDVSTAFQISSDGKHFAFACDDDLYIGDRHMTNKIKLSLPAKAASNAYFISNERVGFLDSSVNIGGCSGQYYSVDLLGTALKNEGINNTCY